MLVNSSWLAGWSFKKSSFRIPEPGRKGISIVRKQFVWPLLKLCMVNRHEGNWMCSSQKIHAFEQKDFTVIILQVLLGDFELMYIYCIYMYTCIHAWMHTCIRVYMHECTHAYVYACIHPSIHSCIQPSIQPSIHPSTHTLQHITTHYNTLQHITTHYNTLQRIATDCNTYNMLHCTTLHCITWHYIALYYIALHYIKLHTW